MNRRNLLTAMLVMTAPLPPLVLGSSGKPPEYMEVNFRTLLDEALLQTDVAVYHSLARITKRCSQDARQQGKRLCVVFNAKTPLDRAHSLRAVRYATSVVEHSDKVILRAPDGDRVWKERGYAAG